MAYTFETWNLVASLTVILVPIVGYIIWKDWE